MIRPDIFSEADTRAVAAQIKSRMQTAMPFDPDSGTELFTPQTQRERVLAGVSGIGETFKLIALNKKALSLSAAEAAEIPNLAPFIADAHDWHHQLRGTGSETRSVAVAESREATADEQETVQSKWIVTRIDASNAAHEIDRAIDFLDEQEHNDTLQSIGDAVVRLLSVPSRQVLAFTVSSCTPANPTDCELVLVIMAPFRKSSDPFKLASPGEFLAQLISQTNPVVFPDR